MTTQFIEVGYVVDAYGIKGWVKVQPFNSAGDSVLKQSRRWWLSSTTRDQRAGAAAVFTDADDVEILSARVQGQHVVAQLMGIVDRDQALALRGRAVAVRRSDLPVTLEQEFYWLDLINCVVVNKEGFEIGPVAEVFENGVHSILRVAREPSDILIPFVKQYVGTVDSESKRIEVDWPTSWVLDDE